MTRPDKGLPLSATERQKFDEIEKSLSDADPATARNSITTLRRRSSTLAGVLFAIGIIALIAGIVETQNALTAGVVISVAGFAVMVWAVTRLPQFKSAGRHDR